MPDPHHRRHFWDEQLAQPPCGTPEECFEWADAIEDVTCEGCLEALAGDSGYLGSPVDEEGRELDHSGP